MSALPYTARGNALGRGNDGTDTFVELQERGRRPLRATQPD